MTSGGLMVRNISTGGEGRKRHAKLGRREGNGTRGPYCSHILV